MPGGRPKSQVWQLFDGHDDGVKCKRCPVVIVNPKPLKLESHLSKCSGYTLLEKNKRKRVSEEREEERVRRDSRDNGAAVNLSSSGDVSAVLQGASQADMEMRIANFVYESGSAFRIVELPSFTFMMNGANPALTIPSAKKVGDELLTASFEQHTEKKYLVMQKDHAFVAVAFDGWSNLKREKMINVVASSPNMGVVHIKTIAVGFDSQTGKYIARLMIREIGELKDVIGPGKVASCTTDNAGNMEKAWEILEKRGIFCNGCADHTFNLLLQDVAKLDEVKAVAAGAEAITAYFMGRHKLLARFKAAKLELAQSGSTNVHGRSFTIPVATRWYSAYQCLVNVIRNREAVTNVFDDEEFMESYKGIKKRRVVLVPATKASRKSKRTKKKSRKVQENAAQQQQQKSAKQVAFEKVETIVRDENFWETGEQVIKLLEPIIEKLWLMEADGTCISLVYWAFNDLLKKPIYRTPTVLVDAAKRIHALIKARWDKMHTDAMEIAYFLDPSQDPRGFVDEDRKKTKNQIRKVAKRLGFSKDEVDQCLKEAGVFLESETGLDAEAAQDRIAYDPLRVVGRRA